MKINEYNKEKNGVIEIYVSEIELFRSIWNGVSNNIYV